MLLHVASTCGGSRLTSPSPAFPCGRAMPKTEAAVCAVEIAGMSESRLSKYAQYIVAALEQVRRGAAEHGRRRATLVWEGALEPCP